MKKVNRAFSFDSRVNDGKEYEMPIETFVLRHENEIFELNSVQVK